VILLDTNVLIRLVQVHDADHPHVVAAITKLSAQGEEHRVVPQNLYEFWVVATRPLAANGLGLSAQDCERQIEMILNTFPLLPDHPRLFTEWQQLVVAHQCLGKIAHDARLVAAMRTHGLTRLMSFNSRISFAIPAWWCLIQEACLHIFCHSPHHLR
jgi:predicted nucleic acid-binding protein